MLNNNLFQKSKHIIYFYTVYNSLTKINCVTFIESVWIYCLLSVLCVLVIFAIVRVIIFGPSNFIDECLELFGDSNKQTWVFLVAGSKGWDNYRHQVYKC